MLNSIFLFLPFLFLVLFIAIFITNKLIKIELQLVKYAEIDGIRGYLAFFVFLHHSYIWSVFLKTDEWKEPTSNLFNQFGQTSVAMFFMITAFLFTNKLILARNNSIDWKKYIKSRFFRLFPAYFFSIIIVFIIVAVLSNFKTNDSILSNFKNIVGWLFFTIGGPNDINNIKNTYLIDAGVTWSLPYECLFYLILPLIALLFKIKVSQKNLIIYTIAFIVIAVLNHVSLKQFLPFFGGIIVAILLDKKSINLKGFKYSIVLLILVFILIYFFNSGKDSFPILISTLLFLIIASGNSIFGILSNTFSKLLGQVTYSLYLLHGIVLFIVFKFVIGFQEASHFSDTKYWAIIACCIFPIILISQISYKYIELPFINLFKSK
ncbi:acyltransferase family protein [Flavobacterium sp.]|uniref:acyltransferase family protein n=1 Tax=Flavobacterium sp. TaxID=239 RepID=UPI003752F648